MTDTPENSDEVRDSIVAHGQNLTNPAGGAPSVTDPAVISKADPTSTDIDQLLAAINAMQTRLDTLEAEKAQAGGEHALIATVRTLLTHLPLGTDGYGLGEDLLEAAANAVKSGDTHYVSLISGKLSRWLRRNAPQPGENYNHRNAADILETHLPDAADTVTPPASAQAPPKVVAGSVTG